MRVWLSSLTWIEKYRTYIKKHWEATELGEMQKKVFRVTNQTKTKRNKSPQTFSTLLHFNWCQALNETKNSTKLDE